MNISLTQLAHKQILESIKPGDIVIDATVGNGHDTLFLAQQVGKQGIVYGFDIQQQAIDSATQRLQANDVLSQTRLFHAGHEQILELIPKKHHGSIRIAMFNLGYLPGSDKELTTQQATTLTALKGVLSMLSPGGMISILAYTGHPGGKEEYKMVREFIHQLPDDQFFCAQTPDKYQPGTPALLTIKKLIQI